VELGTVVSILSRCNISSAFFDQSGKKEFEKTHCSAIFGPRLRNTLAAKSTPTKS
jgi:hypothetical protein